MPLSPDELEPLLRLALVRGVGPQRLTRLLGRFGSAERVIAARRTEVRGIEGIGEELARRISTAGSAEATHEVRIALRVLEKLRAHALTLEDALYPEPLRKLADPPYLLFCIGDPACFGSQSIAVVGTRSPSVYGRRAARELGEQLASRGYGIVSGMARGIDAEAHHGALFGGGCTIGVLGHGIDRIYPPESRELFLAVRERGALLTEYAPGETPKAGNFPRRNRLIAALAQAVVVVEMGLLSGAQHTVNYALEQGKDVMAVPGPIGAETSEGTNRLIQDGAPLVTSAEDILEVLHGVGERRVLTPRAAGPGTVEVGRAGLDPSASGPLLTLLTEPERRLMTALSAQPAHIDEIAVAAGLGTRQTLVTLLELELRGLASALPGKRFVRS